MGVRGQEEADMGGGSRRSGYRGRGQEEANMGEEVKKKRAWGRG